MIEKVILQCYYSISAEKKNYFFGVETESLVFFLRYEHSGGSKKEDTNCCDMLFKYESKYGRASFTEEKRV